MFKRISPPLLKVIFCGLLLAFNSMAISAQEIPVIPSSLLFGGINVKLENSARRIIEDDVRSLMANRRYWEDKMDRAILYFPILEGVLIEEEVPIDFKYLAVQESSLSPDAVSSSNAVGYWQFKAETAQELGLRVDNQIDERKNITSSTIAAARYLKRSNQQFNNWVSSLYSYYQGMGGVSKLVPTDWAYAREITLNGKTDRYVLRFFAHKIALEAGMERYRTANTIVLLEYPNGKSKTIDYVAQELNLDPIEVRKYNVWLNSDQVPTDRDYVLTLPVGSAQINSVREKLMFSLQEPARDYAEEDIGFPVLRKASVQLKGRNDPIFYEINSLPGIMARPGDKSSDLAKAAKISTSAFLKYNDLEGRDPLIPGDVYYLAKKNKKAMVPFHTVREQETIRNISQIYGIRTKDLIKYNRLSSRNLRLQTGRVMWLMKKRPSKQPVEIIESKQSDVRYSEPQLTDRPGDIPQTPSDRKKYTPVLADKQPDTPTRGTYQSSTPTPASNQGSDRVSGGTSDRVVIISQNNPSSTSEFDSEPQRTVSQRTVPSRTSSSPSTATRQPVETTQPTTTKLAAQYHTVESGQTFYSISQQYSIAIKSLLEWNDLTLNDRLAIGQKLIVSPTRTGTVSTYSTNPGEIIIHTVTSGENLFRISKRYGVSMEEIQQLNNMTDTNVLLGQKLRIPKN